MRIHDTFDKRQVFRNDLLAVVHGSPYHLKAFVESCVFFLADLLWLDFCLFTKDRSCDTSLIFSRAKHLS